MDDFVEVARIEELSEDGGLEVIVGRERVALFYIKGKVHAIGNHCPHQGGPLHEGIVNGLEVACPWHGWTFDLQTGRCTFVEGLCVATFETKVENGKVYVAVARDSELTS